MRAYRARCPDGAWTQRRASSVTFVGCLQSKPILACRFYQNGHARTQRVSTATSLRMGLDARRIPSRTIKKKKRVVGLDGD